MWLTACANSAFLITIKRVVDIKDAAQKVGFVVLPEARPAVSTTIDPA